MKSLRCRLCCVILALMLYGLELVAQEPGSGVLQLQAGVPAHAQIDAIYRRFAEAYKTLDPRAVAELYCEEALYLSPGSAILQGRQKIQENFAGFFAWAKDNKRQLDISFRIVSRQVAEPLAYDVGIYTLESFEQGKQAGRSQGKFVVVARKNGDGVWQFQVDGYSDIK